MTAYTPEAEAQVDALRWHYVAKGWFEAAIGLDAALDRAEHRIESTPFAGLPAPRPYPALARRERLWIKEGRYWVAYRPSLPPVIIGVFFDQANIPGRS